MKPLIEQTLYCTSCDREMEYVLNGQWDCECGMAHFARWLDGPGLVAWLADEHDLTPANVELTHPNTARRMRDWEKGTLADCYRVDEHLLHLRLRLSLLPDHLWIERKQNKSHTKPEIKEKKEQALRLIEGGMPKVEVARELGVSTRSIRNWTRPKRAKVLVAA